MISSTEPKKVTTHPLCNQEGHAPLTALFSPLRESLSHLRNSWDGGTGSLELEDTGAGFALVVAEIGRRTALPFARGPELGTLMAEVEGVTPGRGAPTAAAELFPFGPTTVHALACAEDGGIVYEPFQKIVYGMKKPLTFIVDSAYARLDIAIGTVSFTAVFFRLSSS